MFLLLSGARKWREVKHEAEEPPSAINYWKNNKELLLS